MATYPGPRPDRHGKAAAPRWRRPQLWLAIAWAGVIGSITFHVNAKYADADTMWRAANVRAAIVSRAMAPTGTAGAARPIAPGTMPTAVGKDAVDAYLMDAAADRARQRRRAPWRSWLPVVAITLWCAAALPAGLMLIALTSRRRRPRTSS